MAWADIDLYQVREAVTAAHFATLKSNIEYLKTPNYAEYHHPGTGANYTTTTLGEDLDSTNFSLTINTTGGLVWAMCYGQWKVSAAGASVRANIVKLDPISYVGRNLFYNYAIDVRALETDGLFRGWIQPFTGLPAGSHTFRVVWGIGSAGTATLLVGYRPHFWVWEV
jgi:hypothetical protein